MYFNLKGLSEFMKNQLLLAPKYVDIATGIFGDSRRKTKIRRGLTVKELKLKHVQRQIDDTLKLILHHEQCMQSCGDDLARLIQKQKTLETTR